MLICKTQYLIRTGWFFFLLLIFVGKRAGDAKNESPLSFNPPRSVLRPRCVFHPLSLVASIFKDARPTSMIYCSTIMQVLWNTSLPSCYMRYFCDFIHGNRSPLTRLLPNSKRTFSQLLEAKCMSEVVRIGSIIISHMSKWWNTKFFILCDEIFLVRLQGKFEIDHSWVWKG